MPTPEGTIVQENFDNEDYVGKTLPTISGTNWAGGCNETNYTSYSKVVAKNTISGFDSADANDYCIEFTPLTTAVRNLDTNFSIVLDEAVRPSTGTTVAEDKYVVVEMDMAVTGSDTKANGFGINLNGGARTSNPSYLRLLLDDDSIGTSLTGSAVATEGNFGHLKAVINRETEAVTYLWNDVMIASDVAATHGSDVDSLGHIRFIVKYETSESETTDSRMYVDNVKVYYSDIDQKPTPEPTAQPTPEGTIVLEDFNNEDNSGKTLPAISGTNWFGACNENSYTTYSKVVAKNTISGFESADASDYCIEFTPLTTATRNLDLNFSFVLDEAVRPAMGSAVTEDPYVIVEMDMMMTGNDTKAKGFRVNLNSGARTENYSLARFVLFDTNFAHYEDVSTVLDESERPASTEGVFNHLKAVINRETRAVSYYWNEKLIAIDTPAIHDEALALGHIRIQLPFEALSEVTDSRFYLDNVNIHYADESPVPTPTPAPCVHEEADERGYCTSCGKIANGKSALKGRNLVLDDSIAVNFHINFAEGITTEDITNNYKMKFTYNNKVSYANVSWKDNGTTPYFSCEVYASEMGETITAELYEGESTEPLNTFTYSVKTYCDNQLEDETSKEEAAQNQSLIKLLNSTMEYGAMSQLYFDKDITEGELVTTNTPAPLTEDDNTKLSGIVDRKENTYNDGVNYFTDRGVGMTLVLFAETALRAGMFLAEDYTIDDFDFVIYQVTSDTQETVVSHREGTYQNVPYFEVPNIAPNELDNVYKFVIKLAGTEDVIKEITYSPMTYIKNKLQLTGTDAETVKLKNVVLSMYRYNQAAEAYVESTSTN